MATAPQYVRLKPYDPRQRHFLRAYFHGPSGQKFDEKRGWYKVSEAVAQQLTALRQIESDPRSPFAFDVCTIEQAQAIDEQEAVVVERRAGANEANDLTTSELGENRRRVADVASMQPRPEPRAAAAAPAPAIDTRASEDALVARITTNVLAGLRAAGVISPAVPEAPAPAAPPAAAARAPAIPPAQRTIRRGVRDPKERSMRPVEEESA